MLHYTNIYSSSCYYFIKLFVWCFWETYSDCYSFFSYQSFFVYLKDSKWIFFFFTNSLNIKMFLR